MTHSDTATTVPGVLAIEAVNLHKRVPIGFWGRPRSILQGLTLRVAEGEVHGLIGRNGAGKSTLMRVLLGTTPVQSGDVRLWGHAPKHPAARAGVGYAPDIALFPATMSPREIVALHGALLHLSRQAGDAVLDAVGLTEHAARPLRTFSKGMAQRLSLAVALLGAPRLLLLDEPMSGLDPEGRHLVRQLIRKAHAAGTTIVFSSHVLADVEDLCVRATVIDGGRTVVTGLVRDMTAGDGSFTLTYRSDTPMVLPGSVGIGGVLQAHFSTSTELTAALVALGERSDVDVVSVQSNRRGFEDYLHGLLNQGASGRLEG